MSILIISFNIMSRREEDCGTVLGLCNTKFSRLDRYQEVSELLNKRNPNDCGFEFLASSYSSLSDFIISARFPFELSPKPYPIYTYI